ncbi:MAG TPA: Rieske 2Fe-2S domain-containing protein [Burkholderiales bacterium]|nr:Rieske 2Fe-2S domain-containing protein [Burkholderiales bacterium]
MQEWRSWPHAPAAGTVLCALDDIPDGGAKEAAFGEDWDSFRIVLLRSGREVRAYRNRCAHVQIPMNYEPGIFHVLDGGLLMCAHHGATYRFEDGFCVDGPCEGSRLQPVPVSVVNDAVLIG